MEQFLDEKLFHFDLEAVGTVNNQYGPRFFVSNQQTVFWVLLALPKNQPPRTILFVPGASLPV